MHILIIEDQQKLAENTAKLLTLEHYTVSVANDGRDGFEKAMTLGIDLIILDINLPGMDGYLLCSMLRQHGKNMPILMLTARGKQQEIVHGLDIGADDYLTKPFDFDVLLARVRALLRRGPTNRSPELTAGAITLDPNAKEVHKGKKEIDLSPKEFALLEFLLRNKGIVQERTQILEHVWGGSDNLLFSQTVDVHIAYLRKKIGKSVIETVPGRGYMIPRDS